MNTLIILLATVVVIIAVTTLTSARKRSTTDTREAPVYSYGRRDFLITKNENDFLVVLKEILQDRYQVFPQIHLTALLDEKKVKGQNWKAAFRHINGKSVDFVICDRTYARPFLAIELDDFSHDTDDRHARDIEVERIFNTAGMPLLRFRDYKTMGREAIAMQINTALQASS